MPETSRVEISSDLPIESKSFMIEPQQPDGDFVAAEEGNRNNSTSTVRKPRSNPPALSLGHLKRPQSS